jgi:DNA polymerase III subunit delta'
VLEGKESEVLRARLLERLARRENDPLALTDACSGGDLPQVVVWLQKWIYDLAAVKLNEAPRYHPEANEALRRLGSAMPLSALLTYQRRLAQARAVAQHPLNPRLFLEDLFMQYRALQR